MQKVEESQKPLLLWKRRSNEVSFLELMNKIVKIYLTMAIAK